ncbi:hypothetical protein B0H34DRAFT_693349 [Crassisporium funariophilum]|nr:hypothetical protein B0H34DRAFT_693349 [Crassisporium funariophilum]
MPLPALPRQVRSVLEGAPDALPLNDLLILVDDFVLECASSEESEVLIFQLEEDLQAILHEVVDYASLHQTEIFLAILYHLGPILPLTSVISWFDLVLRPALREPKLPTQAVTYAKELIISALQTTHEAHTEMAGVFRKRLLELYLLDAFNEGSGADVLEWAELNEEERRNRTHWKHNLEDILVKYGNERPEDLLNEINVHFATPSSRLQLLALLNVFTSAPSFSSAAKVLPRLPLMLNLLHSLFFDNSSTVCTIGISLIVKLLPFFAVYAREDLRAMLPKLMAVLARIMCWKERRASKGRMPAAEDIDADFERELEFETNPVLHISPNIEWERLEMTFNATASPPPSSRPYFTMLYYLYPSNVLKFLRGPVSYLISNSLESPYVETWEKALDENEIRRRSENLFREHNCHPLLIWRDAIAELAEPEFWTKYDLSRIISEAPMLDIRNLAVGIQARYQLGMQGGSSQHPENSEYNAMTGLHSTDAPQFLRPIDLSSGKAVISLQDMINTTIALKSNLDLEVVQPSSQWPNTLFSTTSSSSLLEQQASRPPSIHEDQNASHVAQAISGLQREVLLLRNDLNFELWLARENAKHIARLYQDRILMKTAEAERQGLYNKLRKYRAQVISLEAELREHKQQASNAKNKYADWNTELQKKLKELRDEKKSWITEAATLRGAQKETQALFVAQGKLLADATKEVFDLQTQRKEVQHKIDRLRDYERQIDQHIKVQRMWDEDFAKFNERADEIESMKSYCRQMEMRVVSMESSQAEMDDSARVYRRQIQTLEAKLNQEKHKTESPRIPFAQEIASFATEKATLAAANTKLREENMDLKEEVEELRAMMELLKGQHSGRRGLVSEPRSSPILSSFSPSFGSYS